MRKIYWVYARGLRRQRPGRTHGRTDGKCAKSDPLLGDLKKHQKHPDGSQVVVHRQQAGSIWEVRQRPTSIWIHMALYERFIMIPFWWSQLRHGAFVACRSRWRSPEDLYGAGHSAPMICGRVCLTMNLKAHGWVKARDTKQYYCPTCARGPCTAF